LRAKIFDFKSPSPLNNSWAVFFEPAFFDSNPKNPLKGPRGVTPTESFWSDSEELSE